MQSMNVLYSIIYNSQTVCGHHITTNKRISEDMGFDIGEETFILFNISVNICLQGGEPDLSTVSKMVLNDWQRGRIPFFVKPPGPEGDQEVCKGCAIFFFLNRHMYLNSCLSIPG